MHFQTPSAENLTEFSDVSLQKRLKISFFRSSTQLVKQVCSVLFQPSNHLNFYFTVKRQIAAEVRLDIF